MTTNTKTPRTSSVLRDLAEDTGVREQYTMDGRVAYLFPVDDRGAFVKAVACAAPYDGLWKVLDSRRPMGQRLAAKGVSDEYVIAYLGGDI